MISCVTANGFSKLYINGCHVERNIKPFQHHNHNCLEIVWSSLYTTHTGQGYQLKIVLADGGHLSSNIVDQHGSFEPSSSPCLTDLAGQHVFVWQK